MRGRFEKGKSGNPGGRPKVLAELRALAQSYTQEAIETLVKLMRSGPPPVRRAAASEILDRGHGKPVQEIHTGELDGQLIVEVHLVEKK